jgi:hypothetical protein
MRTKSVPLFLTGSLLLAAILMAHSPQASPKSQQHSLLEAVDTYAPGSLGLRADGYHEPISLPPTEFRALPQVTVKVHNGHSDADESYSGVLLATLLAKVNVPLGKELRGPKMTLAVLAKGEDGYSVLLSLAEIDPDFHANQVMVADTKDGQPLGKNGPFQLIVPDDKRPARWVHNLISITLQQLLPGGGSQ